MATNNPTTNDFIDTLPKTSGVRIVLEDQFNEGMSLWSNPKGNATLCEGVYQQDNCKINTQGKEDHSLIHFDHSGAEIKATGNNFIALGNKGNASPNLLSTTFRIHKDRKYTVYFRHAGSHNGSQKISSQVRVANTVLGSHKSDCPNQYWASSSYSFTPTADGLATLTFDNQGSTAHESSDTLLDSILVTSSAIK